MGSQPLTPEEFARLQALFEQALQLPESARESFIDAATGSPAMAAELRALLHAHALPDDALLPPLQFTAVDEEAIVDEQRWVGLRMGPWRTTRLIGSGGMGTVVAAVRDDGEYQKTVAIKLLHGQARGLEEQRRFRAERQILARIEHPNVATLLDGGVTPDGQPYLVMEYVDGLPISRWCRERELTTRERVTLFLQVCDAVESAHRNLVVHRDLKPGNILVTNAGQVKLLDFGIARLLPAEDATTAPMTLVAQRSFTPDYAAPELLDVEQVGTAADVYSLGVVLYELLTGRLPLQLSGLPFAQLERRLHTAQAPRANVDADLDAILSVALRKEPERRYSSVVLLSADLRNWLAQRPVSARPDGALYRFGKLIARRRLETAAVTLAVVALLGGLVTSIRQTRVAESERDRAQRINTFLQDILVEADPYDAGADATVRDVLRKADEMIAERFAGEPDLEASLRSTVGDTQLSLMAVDDAGRNLSRAYELTRKLYGENDARTLHSRLQLASLAYERGDEQESIAAYRETVAHVRPDHPADLRATAYNDFAVVLMNTDHDREALDYLRPALTAVTEQGAPAGDLANVYNNIGHVHHNLGELDEAESNYRRALELVRQAHPEGPHPDVASAANNLGVLLYDLGRRDEALLLYVESLQIREATLGKTHPRTGMGHQNLGKLLTELGRTAEARPHLVKAVELARSGLGEDHVQTLTARAALARLDFVENHSPGAVRELQDVRKALERVQAATYYIETVDKWLADARNEASRKNAP